jgi:hypothetical protein
MTDRDNNRARRKRWREHWQLLASTFKLEQGCESCGYAEFAVALDFDHVDPGSKTASVGTLLCTLNPEREDHAARFWAEIAKCRVLCANCHRVKTHTERNLGGTATATSAT